MGRGDYNHTIHLLDDYSRYHWVIFIKSKSDSLKQFEEWIDYIENQTGLTIQVIHGDGGTEFSPTALRELYNRKGKALYLITPGCPKQNGPSECAGQTILDFGRTSLHLIKALEADWPYAKEAAVYIINKLPSNANPDKQSPYKMWAKGIGLPQSLWKPDLKYLHTWGCKAYVYKADNQLHPRACKIMNKAVKGKLYGYKGIHRKIYCVKLNILEKIICIWDVCFTEDKGTDKDNKDPIQIATFKDLYPETVDKIQVILIKRPQGDPSDHRDPSPDTVSDPDPNTNQGSDTQQPEEPYNLLLIISTNNARLPTPESPGGSCQDTCKDNQVVHSSIKAIIIVEEHSRFKAEGFSIPKVAPDSKSPAEPDPPRLGRGAQ